MRTVLCVHVQNGLLCSLFSSGCMLLEVVTAHPACDQWSASTLTQTGQGGLNCPLLFYSTQEAGFPLRLSTYISNVQQHES